MQLQSIDKVIYPTTAIPVRAQDVISNLNSTLLFGDCVGEILTLKLAVRYWSCKLVKIPSFSSEKPLIGVM